MKNEQDVTQTLFAFLTGGGLIALITTAVRSFRTIHTGALSSTRAVVKDLVTARNEAEDRLDRAQVIAEFWRNIAGHYSWQLTRAGIKPEPENPSPPPLTRASQRAARDERRRHRDALEGSGDLLS